MNYETFAAPVAGGMLAGGLWRRDSTESAAAAGAPLALPVLLVHGITASHMAWPEMAAQLLRDTGTPLVLAPDLRGRGRSNQLPAPYGLVQHADDLAAMLDHLGIERALVVGHSMGAFVAVRMAERHPGRVLGPVLIDGGLPLPLPNGVAPAELPALVLGPALERLSKTFVSRESYLEFWREHPAFTGRWSTLIEDYVDYDLDGTEPELSASASCEAVTENALELDGSAGYADALAALCAPIDFIRAPRGLLNQAEALYASLDVERAAVECPALRVHEADDVNHYTIVMSAEGVAQIVPLLAARLGELISVEEG